MGLLPTWLGGEEEGKVASTGGGTSGEKASEIPSQSARVDAQCFLIDNWQSYCPPTGDRKKGYGGDSPNFTCIDGPSSDLLQRLTSDSGDTPTSAFLKMTPAQFALLVPMIRLFKASMDPNTKELVGAQQEVKFKTFLDKSSIDDITRTGRSDMVGLQELSYELHQGGGGVTTGRRQKITIKFIAESIDALGKRNPDSKVSVLDLVLHSKQFASKRNDEGNSIPGSTFPNHDFYAVKVVYGWAVPNASEHLFSKHLRDAIKYSATTLILTLTNHNLSFREDGSVEIEAEYEGYADAKIGESARNILRASAADAAKVTKQKAKTLEAKTTLEQQQRDLVKANEEEARADAADTNKVLDSDELNDAQDAQSTAENSVEDSQEALEELEEAEALLISADRQAKYSRLLQTLADEGRIYHVDVDPTLIALIKSRPHFSTEDVAKMTPKEREDYEKSRRDMGRSRAGAAPGVAEHPAGEGNQTLTGGAGAIAAHGTPTWGGLSSADAADYHKGNKPERVDGDKLRINFMYWGDIFNIVLREAYENKTLPVRYLVGQLVFQDHLTNDSLSINIADIPISLNLFTSWWVEKIIGPSRDTYTIKNFIKESVDELIIAALGDNCFKGAPSYGPLGGAPGRNNLEPPRFEFTVVSAALGQGQNDRLAKKGRISPETHDVIKVTKAADYTKPQNQVEYLFLYCNTWSRKKLSADVEKDKDAGIHHISIGQDAGPVKKITFEKDSDIDLSTQAAMNSSGVAQLVASYKASISMIGNTLFKPGNYIYITPTSMGISPAAAHNLGLGGYYTIADINGKVDSTGWSTELKCIPLFNSYHTRNKNKNPAPESMSVDPAAVGAGPSPGGADPEVRQS